MDIKIRCSVCGLLMIIEEVSSSKAHEAIVMHVSPCPCSSKIKTKKDENQLDEDWSSDTNRLAETTRSPANK